MKKIFIFTFYFLLSLLSVSSFADTFQRIEILGSSDEGRTILIFRSHFGPSSYAPFATLEIWSAATTKPQFVDGLSSFQGGESAISEMKKILVEKNSDTI